MLLTLFKRNTQIVKEKPMDKQRIKNNIIEGERLKKETDYFPFILSINVVLMGVIIISLAIMLL